MDEKRSASGKTGNIRTRLFGPCGTFPESHERIVVDVGALVRRLLLFDTYVLDSYRLLEIPRLVSAFGPSGLLTLLSSGALKVSCEAISFANVGQAAISDKRRLRGLLPLGSYSMNVIKAGDPVGYLSDCLKNAVRVEGMDLKRQIKMKRAIVDALANSSETSGYETLAATLSDIKNDRLLAAAISRAIGTMTDRKVISGDITANVTMIDEADFRVESNLERLGLGDADAVHRIVEKGIGGIINANRTLETMKERNALSGVANDSEVFLGEKLGFMIPGLWGDARERQFNRVIELAGLPDVSTEAQEHMIDVDQLLKIRESSECAEFRQWLQTLDSASDADIAARVRGWANAVGTFVRSEKGKALRFLVTTAIGAIPTYGSTAGIAAGAFDTFLTERLFSTSGPAVFINNQYKSLFLANT